MRTILIVTSTWLIILGVLVGWNAWDPSAGDFGPPGCLVCGNGIRLALAAVSIILGLAGLAASRRGTLAAVR